MRYEAKRVLVQAYQVTRDVETDFPEWIAEPMRNDRIEIDRSLVDGASRVYGCTVRTPEGKMRAKIGDFILLEPDGSLRVMKNQHFKLLYEKTAI